MQMGTKATVQLIAMAVWSSRHRMSLKRLLTTCSRCAEAEATA